jgi:hypothetical protein
MDFVLRKFANLKRVIGYGNSVLKSKSTKIQR